MKALALAAIWFYQRWISPLKPPSCRFYPTCSVYAYTAVERFGVWRGGWLAIRRLLRCHPWSPGGYDPVPELGQSRM
ncbi:MAG: membrane protein insertion efficiency factor YidD [Gloeomargarita sp. SKYB31]|nr:membrane protein insertion efficiency factor YidD [Gloeomargarita sp. SKYG98]MCS7227085.1 membrane protein insertion efficiency factor YidD [Gloeomargarita sp. SKYB31]